MYFLPMLHIPSKTVWKSAGALSLYSYRRKPFVQYSDLGRSINRYKYHFDELSNAKKIEIENHCFEEIRKCLQAKFKGIPPFNLLVPVPPNSDNRISLPNRIAEIFIKNYPNQFVDCSPFLKKTRELESIKKIPGESIEERKRHSMNAYQLDGVIRKDIRGFLVIDDVYQTGTTVREIAVLLARHYPDVPRYLITLTALKENGFKEIPC
jgi:predicted amidophosphoribosyltransferase